MILADIDDLADSSRPEGAPLASSVGSIRHAHLDVRDREGFRELVGEVAREHSGIDYLNNAGISVGGPTADMPDESRR